MRNYNINKKAKVYLTAAMWKMLKAEIYIGTNY